MNKPVTIRVISVVSMFLCVPSLPAQTQAEINAAARADFTKADVDLNKTYQAVLAKLPAAGKQKLKDAQRAWIASRDAEAAGAAKEAGNGSIAPTIRYGRMTDLTRKRIVELKAMIDNGSASGPQTEVSPSPTDQSSGSKAESTAHVTTDSISPNKKWEYKPASSDRGPQIVKTGTGDAACDLSDACDIGSCGDDASVLWAPDSKRVAFFWGQGRTHHTSFYQLRDDHWAPLAPQPDDTISQRLQTDIAAQLKRDGKSEEKLEQKGLYLRYILSDVKVDRWIDSSTVLLYAGDQHVIARRDDPGEMSDGLSADFLFTLKFEDTGRWKIVKTYRLSEKEVKERH